MRCCHQERDGHRFPPASFTTVALASQGPTLESVSPQPHPPFFRRLCSNACPSLYTHTPHFDNVAFNQLSLGILPHFDGQWDGAAGTILPACQLRVIHAFQFPTMHLIRGSAVLKWLRSALGNEVWLGPHPCSWKSSTCAHVRRLLTPHYHFTTPRYETAEL